MRLSAHFDILIETEKEVTNIKISQPRTEMLLSTVEAGKILGVTGNSIQRYIKQGKMSAFVSNVGSVRQRYMLSELHVKDFHDNKNKQ